MKKVVKKFNKNLFSLDKSAAMYKNFFVGHPVWMYGSSLKLSDGIKRIDRELHFFLLSMVV